MLQTFRKAFQIEDIRRKILYTLAMLFVVRLGSQLPTPGVDPTYIQNFFANQTGDSFNFFNAFTGGSFETMSIFALSITPYITSSIIIQLLTIAIPKLEEMQKEGEDGRKKLTALTRYVTVVLALIESTAMAVGFGRQGLLEKFNFVNAAIVVLTLTAGSAFLMWIGTEPVHSIALEDAPAGIRSASAAGMIPVMIPDLAQPDEEVRGLCRYVYPTLLDVIKMLDRENAEAGR